LKESAMPLQPPTGFPLDRFAMAARATPTRTAIRHGERACSYAELDCASDRVAAHLHGRGVRPGEIIGIALERSIAWMAAMLGILKCGAAYLPLDPAYPRERLAFCADDSGARYIIGNAASRHISPDRALDIDALTAPCGDGAAPGAFTGNRTDGGQLAYLLYTSGSTGRPKGVAVSRDALAYQMNWFVDEFACARDDVFLQKTPASFDASIWEYLAPLMVGATMVIADNTPAAVADAARRHRATLLQVVPTVLQALADAASLRDLATLRLLFCGGEPLSRGLVDRVQDRLPIPIVNLYGPTEATVQCAFHVCRPGDGDARDPVPLGRALPGTTLHIAPDGAPDGAGELVIAGPGVASGYHGLPELTAARFGVHGSGQRAYRSGDRAIRDESGDYLFLGRTDNQVKLRGLRIELDEIERALVRAMPALRGAAAVVNGADQIELFVAARAQDWREADARDALAAALPAYMLPAAYTLLDRFPTLPNGKRDRAALRALGANRRRAAAPGPARSGPAAGDVAARVRAAWSTLLPLGAGDDCNFFHAGGHSLLAMQLIAALNRDFGLQLSASALFARPTLRGLTRWVEAAVRDADAQRMPAGFVKIAGRAGQPRVWFIHPAGGGIWCYRDIAEAAADVESYGIACEPLDASGAYESDLRRMARRYADRILASQAEEPVVLCGYSFGGNVAYEMAVHLQARGAQVGLLVLLDTYIGRPAATDTLDFIASYANKLVNGADNAPDRDTLDAMPVAQRNRLLLDLGIQGGHLPAGASLHDLEQGLAMWIANNQAAAGHAPHDVFDGPALFVRCTGNTRDSLEGWPALLKTLRVQDVAADHFTIYKPPAAAQVAALIGAAVQRSAQGKAHAAA
jgi:amino acid adenylation domain-containing protein